MVEGLRDPNQRHRPKRRVHFTSVALMARARYGTYRDLGAYMPDLVSENVKFSKDFATALLRAAEFYPVEKSAANSYFLPRQQVEC